MSFRVRLIISFALLISLSLGVGSTLLISTSFYSVLEEEKKTIIHEFEMMQNNLLMLMNLSDSGDYDNMSDLLYQMEEQNIVHWQALSLKSKAESIYESGDSTLLEFDIVAEDNTYAYVQTVDDKNRRLQMYSELSIGQEKLFLKASFDLSSAYELREIQQKGFMMIYLFVVVLGIGVASIIAYRLANRLERLTSTATVIAAGNLSVRTGLETRDEFEQLSKVFDRMTDKLQDNIEKLEEDVQRQEAFMGAVAHELKTPMTSIIGYADLIRQCSLNEKEQMMAANYIYTEGQRLENLSHKILDLLLMEKDTFCMKEVLLDEFLEHVVNMLLPMAEEKEITLTLKSDDTSAFLEPDLGKSLFYNLIDNAIKATPRGGMVSVTPKAITNGNMIQISDNGCGMEEKDLEKITEAFYRADKSRSRQQGGVGLGLTLCKKIVDLHQGRMIFQSRIGEGSCVTVYLYNKGDRDEE